MIALESGHYYQVRITPHPQECHWNLEAVDSMLPASTALPDSPTSLPQNQPPDPLTAVVSGEAGSWHPGHALYCLWWGTQRRWPHTRDRTATWKFHLDGRQQLEAIPQHERTMETPAEANLCPVFAIHQILVLAMGGQLLPTIRTETKAQAAHAALVHMCTRSLVPSAAPSCDVWGTPQGPNPPQAETGNTPPRTREAVPSLCALPPLSLCRVTWGAIPLCLARAYPGCGGCVVGLGGGGGGPYCWLGSLPLVFPFEGPMLAFLVRVQLCCTGRPLVPARYKWTSSVARYSSRSPHWGRVHCGSQGSPCGTDVSLACPDGRCALPAAPRWAPTTGHALGRALGQAHW